MIPYLDLQIGEGITKLKAKNIYTFIYMNMRVDSELGISRQS